MTWLPKGLVGFFVEDPAAGAPRPAQAGSSAPAGPAAGPSVVTPVAVAVVGGPAVPVAVSLASVLARRARAPFALVCATGPAPVLRLPAAPRASRAARRLTAEGVPAVPVGRVVHAALPGGDGVTVLEGRDRALAVAAAEDALPAVLAVTGPRCALLDAELGRQDAVLLVHGEDADQLVVDLAAERLRERHPALPVGLAALPAPIGPWQPGARAAARAALALAT